MYKELDKILNELETELYRPAGGKSLNISLTNTFINGKQISNVPPVWREVIREIIMKINSLGISERFAKRDVRNLDIEGATPTGKILLQDDSGKKYYYLTKTKQIIEV